VPVAGGKKKKKEQRKKGGKKNWQPQPLTAGTVSTGGPGKRGKEREKKKEKGGAQPQPGAKAGDGGPQRPSHLAGGEEKKKKGKGKRKENTSFASSGRRGARAGGKRKGGKRPRRDLVHHPLVDSTKGKRSRNRGKKKKSVKQRTATFLALPSHYMCCC